MAALCGDWPDGGGREGTGVVRLLGGGEGEEGGGGEVGVVGRLHGWCHEVAPKTVLQKHRAFWLLACQMLRLGRHQA